MAIAESLEQSTDANFMVGVSLKTRVTERESDVLGKHGKQMVRLYTPEKKTYKRSMEGPCHRRRVEAVSLHQSALPTHEQSLSLTESIPPTHKALSGGDFVGSEKLSQMMKSDSGRRSCRCRH